MWRRAILVLALLDNISSQTVSISSENVQPAEAPQYDFVKCCPCPRSEFWEKLASGDIQSLGDIQGLHGVGSAARASSDGCQCQDAEGSPSLMNPRTSGPLWTIMSPQDNKEDKTFLHPEVDMASGVLETLRQATDEEYREALARDAARSASADEDKPIVTIVVSADDDSMSEASEPVEARVAPSVDSKEIGTIPLLLQPLHKILGKNTADVNERVKDLTKGLDGIMLGTASDIHEKIAEINKGIEGLKHKEKPVLSLLPGKEKAKSLGHEHLKNILKINDLGSKLLKNPKDNTNSVINLGPTKISGLKTPLLRRIKPLSIQAKDLENNADSKPAASNLNPQTIGRNAEVHFGLKSLLPRKDTGLKGKEPLTLDNLLNLKDVELIPSKPLKLNLPVLNLLPKSRRQNTERRDSKKCEKNATPLSTDIHKTPDTEILDVVPSASEIKGVSESSNPTINSVNNVLKVDDKPEFFEESSSESATDIIKTINQDPKAQKTQKYVDHGVEIIISTDGDTEIENVSVEREFTNPDFGNQSGEESETILSSENSQGNPEVNKLLSEDSNIDEDQTSPLEDDTENVDEVDDENGNLQEARDSDENSGEIIESEEKQDLAPETSNNAFQFISQETEDMGPFTNLNFRTEDSSAEDNETINGENSAEIKTSAAVSNESNESEDFKEKSSLNLDSASDSDQNIFEESSEIAKDNQGAEAIQNELSQGTNSLPSIKERISIKLKTLQNPKAKVLTVARLSKENRDLGESKETNNDEGLESTDFSMLGNDDKKTLEVTEKSSELLESGEVTDSIGNAKENGETINDDMSSSATVFKPKLIKAEKPETSGKSDLFSDNISDEEISDEFNDRSPTGPTSDEQESKAISDKHSKKGASIQLDVIVQPSSQSPSSRASLFNRPILPALPALPELPELPELPTIEDLNARIANLLPLGGLAKAASNEDTSIECKNLNGKNSFDTTVNPRESKDISGQDSNTAPSLRQDVIVQPAAPLPFSGGSLFNRPILPQLPPLPELPALPPLPTLNLNAGIPTIEDLNARIANILPLRGLARAASSEEDSGECANADPTVGASSKSSNSILPPLKSLQDVNLDIFRLNPLGLSSSLSPKLPSLNIKTYKTKLSLPENLGLKPLELQHSFGNKKTGLFGAKLRFGPTEITRNRGLETLGNRLGLPNVDFIRDSMKTSASSLLKSPILLPPPTLLGNGLPTVEKIADDLKFHAENLRAHHENAAKNVQETLASTLSEVKLKGRGATKSKYAHPQPESLLEKVAIAHDDLNDKLRGIHVDLQDRLTTLHDDILEKSKLPPLKLSTSKLSDVSPLARALGIEKPSPSKSRTSSSSRKGSTRKPGFKINKPSQTKEKSPFASSRSSSQDKLIKPFKFSTAATSLQPKTIEAPKLKATSSKPPFTRPLTNPQNLKDSNIFSSKRTNQRDSLIKPFKPLGDVKITIGTTPRPTSKLTTVKSTSRASKHNTATTTRVSELSTAKPRTKAVLQDRELTTQSTSKPTLAQMLQASRELTTQKTIKPTLAQRLQASRDSKGFASEVQPTRILPPSHHSESQSETSQQTSSSLRSSLNTEKHNKNVKTVKKTPISSLGQSPKRVLSKELAKKGLNFKPVLKSAIPTKTTESPVLSKLREAIQARIESKSKDPETLVTPVSSQADQEMLRSASENNEIKVVQKNAMKENVTYKCKMMCSRDF